MYKRQRGSGPESTMYGSLRSINEVTTSKDGSVHYNTGIGCNTSYDAGQTPNGAHGRYARYRDTRLKNFIGDPSQYNVSIVRGSVTSNCIPLCTPKPSKLITENGVQMWELAAQPGLALTWTGPVYSSDIGSGMSPTVEQSYATWPTYGVIPFYTGNGVAARVVNYLDCSTVGVSNDCLATAVASRISALFTSAGLNVTVAASSGGAPMTQLLTFTNNGTTPIYLDFTLPSLTQEASFSGLSGSNKAGILQACKILGFIPNTVLTLPVAIATAAPRAFQLGFRNVLSIYAYKNIRWVPEDTSAFIPAADEIFNAATGTYNSYQGTYFDLYSYSHFLNQCVNPTFQRCIYDELETQVATPVAFKELSLLYQLRTACEANCAAVNTWSALTSYTVGNSVVFNGRAYLAVAANINQNPSTATISWFDCGYAISRTFVAGRTYLTGDVVTYPTSANTYHIWRATGTTTGTPGSDPNWTSVGALQSVSSALLTKNTPSIGTLAPVIQFSPATQLFTAILDSYGFGGTQYANADDGYLGFIDNPSTPQTTEEQDYNSSLNDIARDSWGLAGTPASVTTPAYTTARRPFQVYDEKMVIEADDYFNQLFGNWPLLNLSYTDPNTGVTTSYVRYLFQASAAGLTVPVVLPLQAPTAVTSGYFPYGRVAGNQPYLYTFPQDYPSVGLLWNPVDTIVIATSKVPVQDDQQGPNYILSDSGTASVTTSNGNTLKLLGEFTVRPTSMQSGQEFRNTICFEPQAPDYIEMETGQKFNEFDYQVFLRMKATQTLRPLSISNGGSVNVRWLFARK